jgi:hypothetical protein
MEPQPSSVFSVEDAAHFWNWVREQLYTICVPFTVWKKVSLNYLYFEVFLFLLDKVKSVPVSESNLALLKERMNEIKFLLIKKITINTGTCYKNLMHKISGYLVKLYKPNQYAGVIINLLVINRNCFTDFHCRTWDI